MYTEQSNQVALEKFKAMIKIMNSKKAPGYDPITAQLLKDPPTQGISSIGSHI